MPLLTGGNSEKPLQGLANMSDYHNWFERILEVLKQRHVLSVGVFILDAVSKKTE